MIYGCFKIYEYDRGVEEKNALFRRVLEFYLIDDRVVVDKDYNEHRATKRHHWRIDKDQYWSRRESRDCTLVSPRPISRAQKQAALTAVRECIKLDPKLESWPEVC